MKILWLDTETSGLDPVKNDIIQIAGIIEIDGVVKEEFNFKCRPHNPATIEDSALRVNKVCKDELLSRQYPASMKEELLSVFQKYINKFDTMDKFLPAGHNVRFDIEFLSKFFEKCGDKYFGSWMDWHPLDTVCMAVMCRLLGKIYPPNLKLQTVCETLGVIPGTHDAMTDIRATREIAQKMLSMFAKEQNIEAQEAPQASSEQAGKSFGACK